MQNKCAFLTVSHFKRRLTLVAFFAFFAFFPTNFLAKERLPALLVRSLYNISKYLLCLSSAVCFQKR